MPPEFSDNPLCFNIDNSYTQIIASDRQQITLALELYGHYWWLQCNSIEKFGGIEVPDLSNEYWLSQGWQITIYQNI